MAGSGKRNVRFRVESDTGTTSNDAGEPVADWTPYCECWGSLRQLSAREAQYASQTWPLATHAIELYGDSLTRDITVNMRLIVMPAATRTLYVFGVEDVDGLGREIKLYAGEKVPQ